MGCGAGNSTSIDSRASWSPPKQHLQCVRPDSGSQQQSGERNDYGLQDERLLDSMLLDWMRRGWDRIRVVRRSPPDAGQSQGIGNQREDGREDENRSQRPADLQRRFVESPAADEAECRRNAQHGQHSKQKAKGGRRVAAGESRVLSIWCAIGLGTSEASEEQSLGECVCGGRNQRTVESKPAQGGDSQQQEADVLDRR